MAYYRILMGVIPFGILIMTMSSTVHAAGFTESFSLGPISLKESLWFLVPFLLSVIILARIERWIRSLRNTLKERRKLRQRPGGSPLNPLKVDSYEQVKSGRSRCRCGERPKLAYEGPTTSKERRLWVQIEICPRCENRVQTYFDVTAAQDSHPMMHQPLTPSSGS